MPPVKCSDPSHSAAVAAVHSLSATQFGRAALERHGHSPVSVDEARKIVDARKEVPSK